MKNKSHIEVSERKLLLGFFDIVSIIIGLYIASLCLDNEYINFAYHKMHIWLTVIIIYINLFGKVFLLYDLNNSNNRFYTFRSILLTTSLATLLYIFTPYVTPSLPENRLQILYFILILISSLTIWRFIYIKLFFSESLFKNVMILGDSEKSKKIIDTINKNGLYAIRALASDKNCGIKNFHDIKSVNIYDVMKENFISELIISISEIEKSSQQAVSKQLIQLYEAGIDITSFASFYERTEQAIPKEYLTDDFYKYIQFSSNNNNRLYLLVHRIGDILISLLGITCFLFIVPLVFIGNLIGNRGGLFYTQERVGKKGKKFHIYKLRSMIPNAEKNGAVWASKNDKRVTRFGKILRKSRLDEVPQFFNILKGDMSLIGPRPERPEFVEQLKEEFPFYGIRHVIRPGLTGWSQVKFPYSNTLEEHENKLRYDLFYIKNRNIFLDLDIIMRTISTVVFMRGQ